MTPAEKMDEIANTLKRLAAYRVSWGSTMGPEERAHLDDIDIPRALTLARELRAGAVEGTCPSDEVRTIRNGYSVTFCPHDRMSKPTKPALLILSDPTP